MNYEKVYNQIVRRAKDQVEDRIERRLSGEYYEGHHIIPKCMGGVGTSRQYRHENIVLLTAREHFLCHWLLYEMYPHNKKLARAFYTLCDYMKNRRYTPSSRVVEYARASMGRGMRGEGNPMYGKTHSDEAKLKISKAHKNKVISDYTKNLWKESGRGEAWVGRKHSEKTREKMRQPKSEEAKERMSKAALSRPKRVCPHCGFESSTGMDRWHFNNCKNKT